jgi:hypothetical protein
LFQSVFYVLQSLLEESADLNESTEVEQGDGNEVNATAESEASQATQTPNGNVDGLCSFLIFFFKDII